MTTGVAILASWDLFILGFLPFAVKNIAVQASQRQVTILRQQVSELAPRCHSYASQSVTDSVSQPTFLRELGTSPWILNLSREESVR